MNVTWTQWATSRSGQQVRQSFVAAVADGHLYREVILFDEGLIPAAQQPVAPAPGAKRMKIYSEAMCFVPTASGTVTGTWALESALTSGERTDSLYSIALSTSGKLYLSIMTQADTGLVGTTPADGPDKAKRAEVSLVYMS